ncbi:MAG TPA: hypothetical protein PL018_15050 [Ignavibacteriaceae bacterium]|nr:hypothetical protein [Ignavibacteriaceae bacterium]HRP91292.1 hypothetical protein [Ignavibacteriaceae bacterium]HRQ55576.1 hypothetical protein [Ignavibacteriaceae bacterium]
MLKLNFSKPLIKITFFFLLNINLFLLVSLGNLTLTSCSTTEPPDIKPPVEPDSTTQNFTFETFEFGDGFSSSYFNDVFIFDQNNIWVCGNVLTNDSTDGNLYHWNGHYWNALRLNYVDMEGIWGINGIIYLASNGLWRYNGLALIRQNITGTFSQGQGVHKLWGSSENNIWGVGPNGTIVHFDGTAWSKIDFDEGFRFDAITGSKQTGIAYASATSQQFNTIIVELKNGAVNIIYDTTIDENHLTSFSIGLFNEETLILGNKNVWTFNILSKETEIKYVFPINGDFITLLAIYKPNDIYFFADKYGNGEIMLHYNGKRFSGFNFSNRNSVIYGGAYAIKDLAVMTGFSNNKAYLIKVKRVM